MSDLVIFDDGCGAFGPLTEMRPAFALRTGGVTTLERIERTLGRFAGRFHVPDALVGVWSSRVSMAVNDLNGTQTVTCVNGRWRALQSLPSLEVGQACLGSGGVIAARMERAQAEAFLATGELPDGMDTAEVDATLLEYPWDILDALPKTLDSDLDGVALGELRSDPAEVVGEHPVLAAESAVFFPGVVLDTTAGRIVVEDHATIRPGAVLIGPCWVGRGATVVDRAVIRPNSVIGPECKVGGEVGASILQGWSNKAHDGYLGDSLIGEWVNLGASTTTSNLLNTYGDVSMRLTPDEPRHATGRAFVGSVIGDHVKTAIGTRFMTGSSIGTGSMIACSGHAPSTLGPMRWVTDAGEKPYRIERFLSATRAMMARRDRDLDAADEARLRGLADGGS